MIDYEQVPEATVRAAEMDLAGRRVAARAIPYAALAGFPRWHFDPLERRFISRTTTGTISVGPSEPEPWRRVLARVAPGNVLVGPCDASEEVRGAYAGASQGAAMAGRGVYLLDPTKAGLPLRDGSTFVVLFVCVSAESLPETLAEAARRGLTSGVLLPLIPGWTCEPDRLKAIVDAAASRGARFVAGIAPAEDGPSRRAIIEARAEQDAAPPEDFFERVHHGDWNGMIERARHLLSDVRARHGLASLPPRPVGRREPTANAAAAGRLEERAEAVTDSDEHRASLLHAAARWIDESGRDLGVIVREGNFRKIFPFGQDIAREAEDAFRGVP